MLRGGAIGVARFLSQRPSLHVLPVPQDLAHCGAQQPAPAPRPMGAISAVQIGMKPAKPAPATVGTSGKALPRLGGGDASA